MGKFVPLAERFWTKVDQNGPLYEGEPCWLWTAYIAPNGYGHIQIDGRKALAHRIAYELAVGEIGTGLVIDHLCRVRHCVNPAHLEPVSPGENIRRGDTGLIHASKTHCPRGHAYTEDNLVSRPRGGRDCKTCHRDRMREAKRSRTRR